MASGIKAGVDYNRIPQVVAKIEAGAERICAFTAHEIERGMTVDVAVDTGTLKRSIRSSRTKPKNWQVIVGAGYGIYVELGTVNTPAQPFALPNVERQRPAFFAEFRALGKSL